MLISTRHDPVAGRLAGHDRGLGRDAELGQHAGDRRGVELAEWIGHAIAHAAEDRALDLDGADLPAEGQLVRLPV